jgi:two-component system, chemotaxis family, response regulator Rcp1
MTESVAERLILVIDANPDHVRVIADTLQEGQTHHRLVSLLSGAEALDFLNQTRPDARPDLILLDLDLPDTDGFDILAAMKGNPKLRQIPIIVFTLNQDPNDIFRSYALQGNCYVVKIDDIPSLIKTVRQIEEFWLQIVTLPIE